MLRDIQANNIIFAHTGIKSLENISIRGNLHETNVFVALDPKPDADLIAAVTGLFTPELTRKIGVTPAERAAREAERIRLTKQLQEAMDLMGDFDRLLGGGVSPANTYLPEDIDFLSKWESLIQQHRNRAAQYQRALSPENIRNLPRMQMDAVWYRLSRFSSLPDLRTLLHQRFPTRFSPGTFASVAFADDISTATFEVSSHIDLTETIEYMKRMSLMQIRVDLEEVADLGDPASVSKGLGIDFSAILSIGSRQRLSVTQQICSLLIEAGFQGAIFPSMSTIGKKNLVIFESGFRSRNPLSILFSGGLKTS